ncbi:MAG: lamin tail domain-containing protein [Candidatus Woesearchaeota archaeon]
MATNPEFQFKKLNDILTTSFTNVKYDVRDINTKIENLKSNFANLSTDSIKTAFEQQISLIREQQIAINQLNKRLSEIESAPVKAVEKAPAYSQVFKTKESALAEVRRMLKSELKTDKIAEKATKADSVYDIPEGEVRITKTHFKSDKKGKLAALSDEWVEVTGYGVDMTGFKLQDKGRKHIFKFPEGFMIYGPVKIFTSKGKDTNTKLFWSRPNPVWNDKGDVASLLNKQGKIVSQVLSEPTYSFKVVK